MNTPHWVDALAVEDLPRNNVLGLTVAGHAVAICTVGGAVHACENPCSQGQPSAGPGWERSPSLDCPLLKAQFGQPGGPSAGRTDPRGAGPLREHAVKVEGGRVFVRLDDL